MPARESWKVMAPKVVNSEDPRRRVGSERVLAVLIELAAMPSGGSLDELAQSTGDAKATVHRALGSLTRSGLARKESRGRYILGDEFLRLANAHAEARPDGIRIRPVLEQLAERFAETVHYAVLDQDTVVYRAKVDPSGGAVRLSSTIGGRNPAHCTGVGKALLAQRLPDLAAVERWIGGRSLEARTPRTATTAADLHARLRETRAQGFAVDDQENEVGVNCIAFNVSLNSPTTPSGAISISALAYRTPLHELVDAATEIRDVISRSGTLSVRT